MWHRVVLLVDTLDNPAGWDWGLELGLEDPVLISCQPLGETKPDPTRDEVLERIRSDVEMEK